jgi:hypothetical protein
VKSRHGDVLATVLIMVGAVTWLSLAVRDVSRPDDLMSMLVVAAVGAGNGAWIARHIREDLSAGEAIGAAALATMLVPAITRWQGADIDRTTLEAVAMALPVTTVLAWIASRGKPSESFAPFRQTFAATATMSAAISLAIAVVPLLGNGLGEHTYDVALAFTGLVVGIAHGALVPSSEAAHPAIGAAAAWFGPWAIAQTFDLHALMHFVPMRFVVTSAVTLAAVGVLGWWLGAKLRRAKAAEPELPAARIHEDGP